MSSYSVRVSAHVARSKPGDHGSRRRSWVVDEKKGTMKAQVFTRFPVVLDALPPEVENDPHLLVTECDEEPTVITGLEVAASESGDAVPDLSKMKKPELVELADHLELDTDGTKEELIQRISESQESS